MANVFDVAKYILNECGAMSAMKLQKLCYYSQAWSLVWDDRPLFEEEFHAWANGPVCKELFHKTQGKYLVGADDEDGSTENLDVNVLMESNYYTEISSQQLKEGMKVSIMQEEESNNPFEYMSHPEGGF